MSKNKIIRAKLGKRPLMNEERRSGILDIVNTKRSRTVKELAEELYVDGSTIRKDLKILHKKNLLKRTFGGAVSSSYSVTYEPVHLIHKEEFIEDKKAIAVKAVELINENDTIFLEASTTVLHLAKILPFKKLTVLTNSIDVVNELSNHSGIDVYVIGGKWRNEARELYGIIAERTLKELKVDKAFLGISSFTTDAMTASDVSIANLKRLIIENSKESIGLTDLSKFGQELFAYVSPISSLRYLIIDKNLSLEAKEKIEKSGTTVILA
ncbi:MAG: DeoR/GlpR family DNA-binding transcription regulator [Candidatus Firestonebacteria bacterium]